MWPVVSGYEACGSENVISWIVTIYRIQLIGAGVQGNQMWWTVTEFKGVVVAGEGGGMWGGERRGGLRVCCVLFVISCREVMMGNGAKYRLGLLLDALDFPCLIVLDRWLSWVVLGWVVCVCVVHRNNSRFGHWNASKMQIYRILDSPHRDFSSWFHNWKNR